MGVWLHICQVDLVFGFQSLSCHASLGDFGYFTACPKSHFPHLISVGDHSSFTELWDQASEHTLHTVLAAVASYLTRGDGMVIILFQNTISYIHFLGDYHKAGFTKFPPDCSQCLCHLHKYFGSNFVLKVYPGSAPFSEIYSNVLV